MNILVNEALAAEWLGKTKVQAARWLKKAVARGDASYAGRQRLPGQRGVGTPLYRVRVRAPAESKSK